jgi:hypothetical protein
MTSTLGASTGSEDEPQQIQRSGNRQHYAEHDYNEAKETVAHHEGKRDGW